jgi:hypothetical protein
VISAAFTIALAAGDIQLKNIGHLLETLVIIAAKKRILTHYSQDYAPIVLAFALHKEWLL